MVTLDSLGIDIYADVGSPQQVMQQLGNPHVKGFTTNPSLMRKEGRDHYESACRAMLAAADFYPISFEVIADEPEEMLRQARTIASWSAKGSRPYVKIPIVNTRAEPTIEVINILAHQGIKVNVTAVMTYEQALSVKDCFKDTPGFGGTPAIISVFVGRVMDTGVDPAWWLWNVHCMLRTTGVRLLWASCREVYNIIQAAKAGCNIITVPPEILAKLPLLGRDLLEYSRETAEQFYTDAQRSGFEL